MDSSIIKKYLELLLLKSNTFVTVDEIKANFRVQAKKFHPDQACEQYKDGKMFLLLTEAKDYLILHIDEVNQILKYTSKNATYFFTNQQSQQKEKLYEATCAFDKKDYDMAFKILKDYFSSIRLYPTPDERLLYGLCCLFINDRYKESHSYLFSFAWGGHWCLTHIVCEDYHPLPESWTEIKKNICSLIDTNEDILYGIENNCSEKMYNRYLLSKNYIVNQSRKEFVYREHHYQTFLNNKILFSRYINKNNGFFVHENNLYFITGADKNRNFIYKVCILNNILRMSFYKFTSFSPTLGCNAKTYYDFEIQILTKDFLHLRCITSDCPCGYGIIPSDYLHINYQLYMKKIPPGYCRLCGGKKILGICKNLCFRYIEKR